MFPDLAKDVSQLCCEGIIPLDSVPSLKRKCSNTTPMVINEQTQELKRPPPGTFGGGGAPKESKRAQSIFEAMSEAFTNMATTLVTAFSKTNPPPSNQ